MSRDDRREAKRILRRHGCNCHVLLTDPGELPPGIVVGFSIEHHRGCPLGDRMLAANEARYLPILRVPFRECER